MILPHVIQYNLPAALRQYARLARACGLEGATEKLSMRNLIGAIERLRSALKLPSTLKEAGKQLLDLKKHKLGQRELALFARRLGALNLVDRQNPKALSHPVAHNDDEKYVLECLAEHPEFLRTPIVRNGEQVTLGADEDTWNAWVQKG